MKVKIKPIVQYSVSFEGQDLGTFGLEEQWEGMAKFKRDTDGAVLIVDIGSLSARLSLSDALPQGDYLYVIVKMSPSLHQPIQEILERKITGAPNK